MAFTPDRDDSTRAEIAGRLLDGDDVRDAELARARHALAYLKARLGAERMRALLADDLLATQARVRGWVKASAGAWRTATLRLAVPGPTARAFQDWYVAAMTGDREAELRAGHPEHFVSHPTPGRVEVIENVAETDLPWQIFYRPLAEDFAFPVGWDPAYSLRYGMEILDADGLRVGYSLRESRDRDGELQLQFTTCLPQAAPEELPPRHLHHFAIEFRNWTRAARLAGGVAFPEGAPS